MSLTIIPPPAGGSREGLYEPVLADSERDAVADLLGYLENVCRTSVISV
jgi:vacuolar protein 8